MKPTDPSQDDTIETVLRPIDTDSRTLKVVARLAEKAHAGQKRRDGSDYIHHPRRVRSILDQFGCTDVQKAIGLLHDVIEDSPEFNSREKLYQRLYEGLQEEFQPLSKEEVSKLKEWARQVCDGVESLSNGSVIYESKRISQVEKIPNLSEEIRPVKIIDQAASVIEDGILHCDVANWDKMLSERGFAAKGFEIARVCSQTSETDKTRLTHQCAAFYERIYLYFMETFRLVQQSREQYEKGNVEESKRLIRQARQRSKDFDEQRIMEEMISKAQNLAKRPRYEKEREPEPLVHFYSPLREVLNKGLLRVTCSRTTGAVVSYGMIVAPKHSRDHSTNVLMGELRKKLEELPASENRFIHVETHHVRKDRLGPVREEGLMEDKKNNVYSRDFRLTLPVPLDVFLEEAKKAEAIDRSFEIKLREKIRPERER